MKPLKSQTDTSWPSGGYAPRSCRPKCQTNDRVGFRRLAGCCATRLAVVGPVPAARQATSNVPDSLKAAPFANSCRLDLHGGPPCVIARGRLFFVERAGVTGSYLRYWSVPRAQAFLQKRESSRMLANQRPWFLKRVLYW